MILEGFANNLKLWYMTAYIRFYTQTVKIILFIEVQFVVKQSRL